MPDPRPLAFVLSGHVILIAITLIAIGLMETRRVLLPGMTLMLVHILGYAAWHTIPGHGVASNAFAHSNGHTHVHFPDALILVFEHAINSPLVLVSKTAELGVLGFAPPGDRGGFIFQPETGLHEDVHGLDFSSLYPNIMIEHNISPDTVRCECHPEPTVVPELGYNICEERGLIPDVLQPIAFGRSIPPTRGFLRSQ